MGRPKQTSSKSYRRAPKKSAQIEYDDCGCVAGLVVYPKSIDDDVSTDCNHVFQHHFKMFLRKQKDKNTHTDKQVRMKNENRMNFAILTKRIAKGTSEDMAAFDLSMVVEGFCTNSRYAFPAFTDDLLEGFDGGDALIAQLKDLANGASSDSGFFAVSVEYCKKVLQESIVKKDLVILAHRWVVEQLDVALEEFKKFRDGLDEKEREKYDKLVEKQCQTWSDYKCDEISFEEMDVITKEIQKEMDDIIARHNYQNKDIDSLVDLIEGKQLGAIPKTKKEKIHKNKKKKNKDIKCKSADQHFESPSLSDNTKTAEKTEEPLNITEDKLEETKNQLREEKSYEASLSDNAKIADKLKKAEEVLHITKDKLEETKYQLREEKSYEAPFSDNAKIADKLKKAEEVLNITKTQIEETKIRFSEEKSYEASLFDNSKIAEEFKKSKEAHNITKAQLEQTKNQLREEKSKNDSLRLKLLHNDFKKYRDVLRQRQKNNRSVIDHIRASPEIEHTPQVQLALRSLHEFSALLLLADQQLSSQYHYHVLHHKSQTHETIPELNFDLTLFEPPDLGSSCINLLYRSILMSQSSTTPLAPPLTSRSSTSSPLGFSLPSSRAQDKTQPSCGTSARPSQSSTTPLPPPLTSRSSTSSPLGFSLPSSRAQDKTQSSRVTSADSGFPPSLLPTGSVVSLPSNGATATCGHTATVTHLNLKPRADQITKLATEITSKKVVRGGGGPSTNTVDESCSICFEEMRTSDSFYLKSCRHRFHVTCLKQWLKSPRGVSSTCPMCRTYIVQEDEFDYLGAARRF